MSRPRLKTSNDQVLNIKRFFYSFERFLLQFVFTMEEWIETDNLVIWSIEPNVPHVHQSQFVGISREYFDNVSRKMAGNKKCDESS